MYLLFPVMKSLFLLLSLHKFLDLNINYRIDFNSYTQ